MNHCFSLQDVSSMKDAIMTRLDWDETRRENEEDRGPAYRSAESTRLNIQTEDKSCIPISSPLNGRNTSNYVEGNQSTRNKEANNITMKNEAIGNTIDRIEKPKTMKEDLESQPFEATFEQRKACQKISETENELENGNNSFTRQKETCNDQMAQLKRTSKEVEDEGKPSHALQTDWEISDKLAECQETLLKLGKQLKGMASPMDASLFNKVIATPADHVITSTPTPRRIVSKRLSLQDKMLEEDTEQNGASRRNTIDTQNRNYSSAASTNAAPESGSKFTNPNEVDSEADATAVASMDIVPHKKNEGRSLWKKLFL